MNRASIRLLLHWLDEHDLYVLLPTKPANPMKGRGYKRVTIHADSIYVKSKDEYNAYIDSISKIFFYELPESHSYSSSLGYNISPEANIIFKLIMSNNFDCDVDYEDVCEFANI